MINSVILIRSSNNLLCALRRPRSTSIPNFKWLALKLWKLQVKVLLCSSEMSDKSDDFYIEEKFHPESIFEPSYLDNRLSNLENLKSILLSSLSSVDSNNQNHYWGYLNFLVCIAKLRGETAEFCVEGESF